MGRFPSGQREQTVNLPSQTSMVRIHPCPPKSFSLPGRHILREWRNWQTRMIQVHVFVRTCRFKSCFPHQSNIIRTKSSLWETGSDYLFISTDTKTPTFRMALSSVPNPNREDRERRKSAIRKTGKAAPIIGELPCLLLCYSVSCGAFTLFAFSICCAFHSANSRCPSSLS